MNNVTFVPTNLFTVASELLEEEINKDLKIDDPNDKTTAVVTLIKEINIINENT